MSSLRELLGTATPERTCARCGASLRDRKPQAVYCSRVCKERARFKRSDVYREATLARSKRYRASEKGKASMRRRRQRAYKKFPERAKARAAVQNEVRRGRIAKPERCQECGCVARVEAHHHAGYDRPLDVLWLCKRCHVAADALLALLDRIGKEEA